MITRTTTRAAALLAALSLGASACSLGRDDETIVDYDTLPPATVELDAGDIVLTSGLQEVSSCDDLLARIKAEALDRVGPYGFGPNGPVYARATADGAIPAAAAEASGAPGLAPPTSAAPAATMGAPGGPASGATSGDRAAPALAAGDSAASPALADQAGTGAQDSSGTNNQETGVDEADLVKTDGERLVVLSNNRLRVIDVTGATPELTTEITLPDGTAGGELFLAGDTALLMTTGWTDRPYVTDGSRVYPSDWYPGSPTGRLLEIDLAGGAVIRTLEFEGSYLSAREVDGTVRIVVSANVNRFAFVYPSNEQATEAAEKANRALIEESTIDQWLPTYRVVEGGDTVHAGPMVDCDRMYLPQEFAGFGSLALLTVDPAQGLSLVDATAVLTDAQTVYASTQLVAVATPRWPTWNDDGTMVDDGAAYSTAVHTFDITDPTEAAYVASGSVPGHLLNQYSLSEHDGYLRVATTAGSPWGGGVRPMVAEDAVTEGDAVATTLAISPGEIVSGQSESMITVLGLNGRALVTAGEVRGLGRGEQIQAVRFLGDKAYVVTFRQTDPLYVVDLADPARPRLAGELKIPGFSSYLHPIDDGHLLGVGTDGDEQGSTFGTVVSLFDVSNPSNPTRTAKLSIGPGSGNPADGSAGSWTPVSSDARAFTWWQGKAVVPVSWFDYDYRTGEQTNGSDAVVVSVDGASGELTEVGRVSQPATRACDPGVPIPVEGDGGIGDSTDGSDAGSGGGGITTTVPPLPAPIVTGDPGPSGSSGASPGVAIAPGPDYCYTMAADIIRSVVIGDDLFTVSSAGVGVHRFDGSLDPVAWIPFA